MSALAAAARAYGERGWPLLPLKPREKKPLIPKSRGGRGVHDATADLDQILDWWDRWPDANIGIACGKTFWVLDIDYQGWFAPPPDGLDTYLAMVERYGRLPATLAQITGSGGFQLFFASSERVNNGVKFLPGTDTRSAGGYVTAPPSIHPCGRTYKWRPGYGPGEIPIATAPEWLLALVEPVAPPASPASEPSIRDHDLGHYAEAALDSACAAIATALPGEQEDRLARQAYGIGRLVAGGVIPDADAQYRLGTAGRQMANLAGRRPWTGKEIDWRVARAFRAAAARPRVPQ